MRNGLRQYAPELLRSMLVLAAVFSAVLLVYAPTSRLIVDAWNSNDAYSHGWLVLFLSAWLVWRQVKPRQIAEEGPAGLTLVGAVFAGILWILGYISSVLAVQSLALVAMLYCVLIGVYSEGRRAALLLPVGILVFSLPLWSLLTPALQILTILVVSSVLSWLGWTAYLVGDVIHIGAGSFRIAAGCGGTHFLVVALVISIVYSHLYIRQKAATALLVSFAVILAIVSNWIRVLTLVVVGDMSDMQHYLIAVDHYNFGWLVFAIAMLPVFVIGSRLQETGDRNTDDPADSAADAESSVGTSNQQKVNRRSAYSRYIVLVVLTVTPPLLGVSIAGRADDNHFSDVDIPDIRNDWRLTSSAPVTGLPVPEFPGAQSSELLTYEESGRQLQLYVNKFVSQRHGAELIGVGNTWYPLDWYAHAVTHWQFESTNVSVEFFVEEIRRGQARAIVIHAYVIGHRIIASELNAKLRETVNTLSGDFVSGAVAVYVSCDNSCDAAKTTGRDFLSQNVNAIVNAIRPGELP